MNANDSVGVRRRCLLWLWGGAAAGLVAACATVAQPDTKAGWTPTQRAALREMGFVPDGDEWDLNLATSLLFEFDSDQLQRDQLLNIASLGHRLHEIGVPAMRVEGHTDAVGDPAYNVELSLRRASAVTRVLLQSGWKSEQVVTRGFGQKKPIADNATNEGRAQNRRVTLIVQAS